METKICTYSEANVRLQLVRITEGDNTICEIRLNRKCFFRVGHADFVWFGTLARLMFLHYVHSICMDRNSVNLSKMTM